MPVTAIVLGTVLGTIAGGGALYLGKKYCEGGVCKIQRDLSGKVVIVTGSSSGIGKVTAQILAAQRAIVVMANRSQEKTQKIMQEIQKDVEYAKLDFIQLDLSDLESVRNFARIFKQKYEKLDILINNAGVVADNNTPKFTKQGIDIQFGSNYVGAFYLTELLLDHLEKAKEGRIINVLSRGATSKSFNWDYFENPQVQVPPLDGLIWSKVAFLMYMRALQKRVKESHIKVMGLHPGVVRTEGMKGMDFGFMVNAVMSLMYVLLFYFGKSAEQGAQTSLYCALEDFETLKGGAFYSDCKEFKYKPVKDLEDENQEKLVRKTADLIKEKLGPDAFNIGAK